MIDYAILCQTIGDWRAGRRPSVILPSSTPTQPQPLVAAPVATDDEPSTELSAEAFEEADGYGVPSYDAGPGGTPREGVPIEGGWSAGAPADVDSTMVYGTGGAMPGGAWDGSGEAHEGEAPAYGTAGEDEAYETEIDADVDTEIDGEPRERGES